MLIQKARYWWSVLYPENMIPDWEQMIAEVVEVPFSYALHDASTDSKSEHRKDHVHLILAFLNTTTYKHAMEVFSLLSLDGKQAANTCKAIINIRHAYDYLLHDTETCRKLGKELYPAERRVNGNGFDIGSYEQIGQEEKNEMLREMLDFCIGNNIKDLSTFYTTCELIADSRYFDVFKSYGNLIERVCKGNYNRSLRE